MEVAAVRVVLDFLQQKALWDYDLTWVSDRDSSAKAVFDEDKYKRPHPLPPVLFLNDPGHYKKNLKTELIHIFGTRIKYKRFPY